MTAPLRLNLTVEGRTVVARYQGETADGPVSKDADGPLDLGELEREMVNVLIDWLREERLRPAEAQLLGKILYRALFNGEVEEFFHASQRDFQREKGAGARLVLQLQFKDDDLIGYPWEFLYGPVAADTEPIFLSTSGKLVLSRYAPGSEEWENVESPSVLKTLVITSLPREILERLPAEPMAHDPMIQKIKAISSLEIVDPVLANPTKDDIERALNDHKPDVVHFLGHGQRVEVEHGHTGEIALCEKDEPTCRWVPYTELVGSFQRANPVPRLVFLHLCPGPRTKAGLPRASFVELARGLSRVPIQAVLGMQYPLAIDQDLNQGFTETFYKQIVEQGSVAAAIQAGRSSAYSKSAEEGYYGVWNIGKPVLYMSTERLMSPALSARSDGSQRATSDGQRDGRSDTHEPERSQELPQDTMGGSGEGLWRQPRPRQESPPPGPAEYPR